MNFAVAIHHAAEPDRAERERHRHLFAEDGGRGVALVDVEQDPLAQLDLFQIGAIGPQRLLRVGAGLGVVEEHLRYVAPRALPQVLDGGIGFHRSPGNPTR
jgi:hypothetical protein